jgi:hypothetical protein
MVQGALFDASEDQRRTVRLMAGFGVPQDDIARFLEIDAKTLRKHFRLELDRGTIEANVKVAQTLFTMATVDKNVAAAIFWMKARAGWREKVAVTGENGGPIMIITGVPRHSDLSITDGDGSDADI